MRKPNPVPNKKEFTASFGINGGKQELLVETDSIVRIQLDSNPSTGYSWVFVNENEIKESKLIEFIGSGYTSKCTSSPPPPGCGGFESYSFLIKDATKELPKINLVYKRSWEKETIGEVVVTLKSRGSNSNSVISASFDYQGGKKEVLVKSGSKLELNLESNPSTGYSWVFVNEDEIKNSKQIDFIGSEYKTKCTFSPPPPGCGGTEKYSFLIKAATKKLPKINLVYKRSWEKEAIGEVIITLKSE